MKDLLIRTLLVVPVATLLPLGLPLTLRAPVRALLAGAIVLAALSTSAGCWQTWAVVACVGAAAAVPARDGRPPWRLAGAMLAVLALASALTEPAVVIDSLVATAHDRRLVAVVAGGLACVFLGGALIGALLHPFAERVGDKEVEIAGMENAGRIIGWIERALLYGLVLVGAPGAAALVMAGKSIARFPSFKEERFAEYYLIGSLMSLAVALGFAVAVRAIIGAHPVAPG